MGLSATEGSHSVNRCSWARRRRHELHPKNATPEILRPLAQSPTLSTDRSLLICSVLGSSQTCHTGTSHLLAREYYAAAVESAAALDLMGNAEILHPHAQYLTALTDRSLLTCPVLGRQTDHAKPSYLLTREYCATAVKGAGALKLTVNEEMIRPPSQSLTLLTDRSLLTRSVFVRQTHHLRTSHFLARET